MAKPWAVGFYHSKSWRRTREAYMSALVDTERGPCPPGMCERCFSRGTLKPAEIVHHRVHLTPGNIGDPNVSLAFSNLMRVCRDCHAELHGYADDYRPRVAFDENGRVIPLGDQEEV